MPAKPSKKPTSASKVPSPKKSPPPGITEVTPKPKKARIEKKYAVKHWLPTEQKVVTSPAVAPAGRPDKPRSNEELINMPWSKADRVEGRADAKLAAHDIEDIADVPNPDEVHEHGWSVVPEDNPDFPAPGRKKGVALRQLAVHWARQIQQGRPDLDVRLPRRQSATYGVEVSKKFCPDCDPSNPNRTEEPPSRLPV